MFCKLSILFNSSNKNAVETFVRIHRTLRMVVKIYSTIFSVAKTSILFLYKLFKFRLYVSFFLLYCIKIGM